MPKMLTSSVIVPTYNRPIELRKLIESLLQQTVLPGELIIVDDGNLQETPLANECATAGIKTVYFKKDSPGLTASRNAGIGLATGEIVFFFDDDVVLERDYIENILKVYDDDKTVGGASGRDMNLIPRKGIHQLRRLFNVLFLISGFEEGKVLPSGFCTEFGATGQMTTERKTVDFLPGCSLSFRKEVFRDFLFDTKWFLNYGMGEDKDFSHRVSKKYKLVYEPRARLRHFHSPQMRPDHYKTSRMFVLFAHTFFKRYGRRDFAGRLLFCYALAGYTATMAAIFIFTWKKSVYDYTRGLLRAIYEILAGKTAAIGQ